MKRTFDYSKLKELIISTKYYDNSENLEKYYNKKTFATALGITYYSLHKKLKSDVSFTQKEILKIVNLLHIDINDIPAYFFTEKVEKTQF